MIYEYPASTEPVRQGDIFVGLPRIDLNLSEFTIVEDESPSVTTWDEQLRRNSDKISAIVGVRPVSGIVITQDCDAVRAPQITLCEIRPFTTVERAISNPNTPKKWVQLITQQARKNLKWFYLPTDNTIGFTEKMAVDFQVTLSILREDLNSVIHLRKARLGPIADEHFRERLSEFFRRYPYDEWYPLNSEEFLQYKQTYPEVVAFSWQSPGDGTA